MRVRLDATQAAAAYSQAFRHMRRLPGFNQSAVLVAEAAVILKTWAGATKVGTEQEARKRARLRAARTVGVTRAGNYDITINVGLKGERAGIVWFRTSSAASRARFAGSKKWKWQYAGEVSDAGVFTPAWIHFKNAAWAEIKLGATKYAAMLSKAIPAAIKSVGLSRQSVIQIADDLGIDLSRVRGGGNLSAAGIAKARAAIASNGNSYRNGTGTQGGDGTKDFVDLMNRLPKNQALGMDTTLALIVARRAKFIETSYAKGAFDSIEASTKAFPQVFNRFQQNMEAALVYE